MILQYGSMGSWYLELSIILNVYFHEEQITKYEIVLYILKSIFRYNIK